jgi:hypothetical protein
MRPTRHTRIPFAFAPCRQPFCERANPRVISQPSAAGYYIAASYDNSDSSLP